MADNGSGFCEESGDSFELSGLGAAIMLAECGSAELSKGHVSLTDKRIVGD